MIHRFIFKKSKYLLFSLASQGWIKNHVTLIFTFLLKNLRDSFNFRYTYDRSSSSDQKGHHPPTFKNLLQASVVSERRSYPSITLIASSCSHSLWRQASVIDPVSAFNKPQSCFSALFISFFSTHQSLSIGECGNLTSDRERYSSYLHKIQY